MTVKNMNWLDDIVEPTALSNRVIVRPLVKVVVNAQFQRICDIVSFIADRKFASAAHVMREHRAENPNIP